MTAKIGVKLLATLSGHNQAVYSITKDEGGAIFSAGSDWYVVKWNYPANLDGTVVAHIPEPIYSLCFDSANQVILAGGSSGALYVVANGKDPRKLVAHEKGVFSINSLVNGFFITTGGDGKVILWNQDYEIVNEIKLSSSPIRSFANLEKNSAFAFGSSDWKIYITNLDLKPMEVLEGHSQSVFAMQFLNSGNVLYSGGRDAVIRSWDLNAAMEMPVVAAHLLHIHGLALSPNGVFLASSSMDMSIKIWDVKTNALLKVIDYSKLEGHKSSVNAVMWLNNQKLVSCSDDRSLKVWEIEI